MARSWRLLPAAAGLAALTAAVLLVVVAVAVAPVTAHPSWHTQRVATVWRRGSRDAGSTAVDAAETVVCTVLERDESGELLSAVCEGHEFDEVGGDQVEPGDPRFAVYVILSILLVLVAGIMSGLTIGLVALDVTALTVLLNSGTPTEKRHAAAILPLVKRRHLLLVTLLLANAVCMEALPLVLDRLASPLVAILLSVTAVLFFGEIIPQALCSRYGLAIGANLVYLVWAAIGLLFVVAWPISKLLDFVLGHSKATYYRRSQLTELVNLHGTATVQRAWMGTTVLDVGSVQGRVYRPTRLRSELG